MMQRNMRALGRKPDFDPGGRQAIKKPLLSFI